MGFIDGISKFSKFQKFVFIISLLLGLSSFIITLTDAFTLAFAQPDVISGAGKFFEVIGSNILASDVKVDMAVERLKNPNIDQFYASYLRETIIKSLAVFGGMIYLFYVLFKFIFGHIFTNIDKDKVNFGFSLLVIIVAIAVIMAIEIMVKIFLFNVTSFPEWLPFRGIWNLITNISVFLNNGLPNTLYVPLEPSLIETFGNVTNSTL